MPNLEENRVYYEHDANCSGTNFGLPSSNGIKKCLDCAGLFDEITGKGLSVTDKRFDSWRQNDAG